MYEVSGIPPLYIETGENGLPFVKVFDVDRLESPRPLQLALRYGQRIRIAMQTGQGLVYWGDNATGKSHLAAIVALMALQQGVTVRYKTMGQVLNEIKEGFGKPDRTPVIERYKRCDLLVLDDVGSDRPTDFARDQLFALVQDRMTHKRPTVYTTNFEPESLGNRLAPSSVEEERQLTSRIIRLNTCSEVVSSVNYRQLQQERWYGQLFGE